MANFVIKKDGTKAPFDVEKIKNAVGAAARGANLPEERKNEVVAQVTAAVTQALAGKEEVTAIEIKDAVLKELDTVEPSVAASWRKYDEEKKKV